MLTSNLVTIQPFDLPQSDSKTVAPTNLVVAIRNTGEHTLNNIEIAPRALERALRQEATKVENKQELTVTIVAEVGTPFDYVVDIMKIASKMRAKAIIATQPKS